MCPTMKFSLAYCDWSAPKQEKISLRLFVSYSPESINTWAPRMKNALLHQTDSNVILVDWSKGANPGGLRLDYPRASGNTQLVGAQTAELIKFLISNAPGSSGSKNLGKRFYIVGFSLGAHVAGYAGRHLKVNGGINLGRITGNALKGIRKDNPFSKLVPENISEIIQLNSWCSCMSKWEWRSFRRALSVHFWTVFLIFIHLSLSSSFR